MEMFAELQSGNPGKLCVFGFVCILAFQLHLKLQSIVSGVRDRLKNISLPVAKKRRFIMKYSCFENEIFWSIIGFNFTGKLGRSVP